MSQLSLFEEPVQDDEPVNHVASLRPHGTCGQCRWMDCSLPGCYDGTAPNGSRTRLGRCTNPNGRSYWLSPENTRACPVTGNLPPNGSWHSVTSDSAACDKVARR